MKKQNNTRRHWVPALLILVACMGFSCEDFLDEQPPSQTSDADFWQNNSQANSGVAAIYDAMQATYRDKHYLWGEIRTDNYIAADLITQPEAEVLLNLITPSNSLATEWDDMYRMINRANLAIDRIAKVPSFDPNLLGEAHALRAYAYFDAVRVWGGVPLFTEPVQGLDQELSRARTDGETILREVVVPDMLRAEELIDIPSREFRFSLASIYCFQANVYIWMKDFESANMALEKLKGLNAFSLVETRQSWVELFLDDDNEGKFQTGPELIFSLKFDAAVDGPRASGSRDALISSTAAFWIDTLFEREWIEEFPLDSAGWVETYPDFEPLTEDEFGETFYGDWRYIESREDRAVGNARVAKHQNTSQSIDDDTNYPIYRYSGMLLLQAMVQNRLGNGDVAIELANQIRTARQLPNLDPEEFADASMTEIEDRLLQDRRYELLGEAKRFWDLRSFDRAIEYLDTFNNLTEETLLLPIFEGHLIDNPLLEQNPGY